MEWFNGSLHLVSLDEAIVFETSGTAALKDIVLDAGIVAFPSDVSGYVKIVLPLPTPTLTVGVWFGVMSPPIAKTPPAVTFI
ncbi:hypothetical protein D3C76_1509150 [compost metagenome]